MLTADLVRVRRRGGTLEVVPLSPAERRRLLPVARQLIELAEASLGRTQGEFRAACESLSFRETDYKRMRGLQKLIEDRCTFEMVGVVEGWEPRALRRRLFARAAAARRELERFDRKRLLQELAEELGTTPERLEEGLYADLRENYRLTHFDPIGAEALLDVYDRAQRQAVLLRALKVVVRLSCADPGGYRVFFRRLKFHRLLYRLNREPEGGYRIEIDGPLSLFQATVKYGLQLALLLPVLESCGRWELEALVRWDRDRPPYRFRLEGSGQRGPSEEESLHLPEEVARLMEQFRALGAPWEVAVAQDLLDLPGVGLCVPDLAFTHRESGFCAYLEVLGYWSREAVWKRVELVEAGLGVPVLFAVSDRLRVSEEVLDPELPARLYVYKGVMNARAILERLEALRERAARL
ncbi:MAG: hypothetical protein KatS3mg115_0035 [Candidatus Poribacteria bacterium]|nr:MAG: hypothetical protein KatS3mg115_0035 [Candidatus Poribacteria bacterium]